ncbi:MAG: hypothetical protein V7765_03710 [Oleispira sp.]
MKITTSEPQPHLLSSRPNSAFKQAMKVASLLSLTAISQSAFSGAWTAAEGAGYNKFAVSSYEATDFYGESEGFNEFKGTNYSLYAEHGLRDDVTLFGTLLYQSLKQTDAAGIKTDGSGLSDVEIGLRKRLINGPTVVSTSFLVKLPYLYDKHDELPLGNGQTDYEARILLGRSLYPYGYIGAEAAYRVRTEDPSDEYRYLIEYGISADDNLYFRAKLDGTESAKNGKSITSGDTNLSATNEYDLGKFEFTVGWSFDKKNGAKSKWGLEATYNEDVYGNNALNGGGYQLGLTREY